MEGLIFGILQVYYSYSYFMGSCYLCYLCTSLKNVLLLKFTPNFSYMQSYEVTPYLLNSVLMISSKLTCCSLYLVKCNLTKLTTTSLAVKRFTSVAVKQFTSIAVKRFTSLAVERSTS